MGVVGRREINRFFWDNSLSNQKRMVVTRMATNTQRRTQRTVLDEVVIRMFGGSVGIESLMGSEYGVIIFGNTE